MKFSEKKIEEQTIVKNDEATSSVQTFRGNPEWDDRNDPSVKVSRTGLYERSYRNKSGSFTAVFDAEASQFRDVDGKYKKVESVLVLDDTQDKKQYKNKANRFAVRFPETLESKVFSVEHGTAKVEFSLVDPTENEFSPAIKKKLKGCFKNAVGRKAVQDGDSTLKYLAFEKDTDIEYSINDDRVKENIILHGKRAQYKFAFVMQCENVVPQIMDRGFVIFYSEDDPEQKSVFRIPAPVMFDGKNEKSDQLHYEIDQIGAEDSNVYLFAIVADKEWINADKREFPVTIDPQIVIEKTDSSPKLLTVDQCISDCYGGCSHITNVNSYAAWNNGCEYSNLIVNVMNPVRCTPVFDKSIRVMRASLIWAITNGNDCGHLNVRVGDKLIERLRYDGPKELRIDITNQMNEMIRDGKESFQVLFDVDCDGNCEQYIHMKQGKDALSLLVDYIPLDLVGQNSESVSFDVKSAGKGSVNLATGNVVFEHTDVTGDSAIMPVSISHVFDGDRASAEHDTIQSNGTTSKISPDYHMGKGWKLNVQQTLVVPERETPYRDKLADKTRVYHIDASGNAILFEKKFFYVQDGVKSFVAESDCIKEGDSYYISIEEGGSAKKKSVSCVWMSDNGLFLNIDHNKTALFDSENLRKYYIIKGEKIYITPNSSNVFQYHQAYVHIDGVNYEVDPRVTFHGDLGLMITLTINGKTADYKAYQRYVNKTLQKDGEGEYFTFGSTICSCCGSNVYEEKIPVFTELDNGVAISISNEGFSDEFIQSEAALQELNGKLVELQVAKDQHILQLDRVENPSSVQNELSAAESAYQYRSLLLSQRQNNDSQNLLVNKKANATARETYYDEDGATEYPDLELLKNELQTTKTELNNAGGYLNSTENILEIQETIIEKAAKLKRMNREEEIATLKVAIENLDETILHTKSMIKKMENDHQILKQKEKQLPCDYIFDESGNALIFDYFGNMIGIRDSSENIIAMKYNDYNRLVSVVTSDEREISLIYNDSGRLESITDTNGRVTKYVYNQSGNLTKILHPEYDAEHPWAQTQFVYDGTDRLTHISDQSGYFVNLEYSLNSISINEGTNTFRIQDGEVIPEPYNEFSNGDSTTITYRSPFVTSVTNKNNTIVYQLDVTGKVMASYEEIDGINTSRKTVSNATSFGYLGKKRSFSVKADPSKENLITNGDFASLSGWHIVSNYGGSYNDYIDGNKGLVLYGNSDYDSRVYQTLNAFASGKRHYLLSLWAKAISAQIDSERCTGYEDMYLETHANTELFDGEARRKFGIKAAVTYVDGTCEDFYASFDWFNTNWQLCQLPMCLKNDPASMIVSFEYGYNVGTAIIDNFRLTEEYGSESRFSDDGKLIWSCDGNIQRFYTYNGGAYPVEVLEVDCEDARSNGCTQNCAECNGKSTCKHAVNKYGFNAKGQLLWSEDHNGIITKNTYDDKGRKIATATYHEDDPTSKFVSESVYDDKGRQTETMDPRGEVNGEKLSQKMDYEPGTNLLTSVISAGGKKTVYGYDHLTDACVSISSDDDGTEHTNRMNFTAGFLTRVDNSSGMCYNYVYDGFGKLVQVLINGDVVASYDETESADGSKISTKMLDGVTFSATSDSRGRVTEVKAGNTILKNGYSYDKADRCTAYTEFPNDPSKKKEHEFKYGETQDSHSVGGETVTNQKDEKGRGIRTTYRFGESDSLAYDFAYEDSFDGTLKSITYNNAIEQSFAHDKLGRQTESRLSNSCGSTVYAKRVGYLKHGNHTTNLIADLKHNVLGAVSHEKYSYDAEGNISAIHEDGKLKVRFAYDNLNRLIREDNKDLGITTVFAYDNGGNLLRQREYPFTLDAVENLDETNTFVYSYGNENRPDQLTRFGSKTISYDANGCPTNYLGNDCTFEYGTRMTQFGSNTFSYDADGLRSTKNNIAYTYMDGKLIRQTGGAAGKIDFIYGASGMIGFEKNGTRYFYRRNLMGDVTHIYNENGTLFAEYVYDAWGNYQIKTDVDGIGTINPIRYRGYYYDTETGLYYLRARYYDPETGRFISQDDVSYLAPEHLSGLNLYAYCNDNPVMGYDPCGTWDWGTFWDVTLTVGAAIVGVAVGIVIGMATGNPFLGVLAGFGTFGLINNAVNFVYYTFISDGVSDLTTSSYNNRYVNRWERLDYTKSQMRTVDPEHSVYNFNAWMYHNEYTFHAYMWWLTGWADNKGIWGVSSLASKAKEANLTINDPLSDLKDNPNLEGVLRIIAYLLVGALGL